MAKVAVVGLGAMGSRIARRLLDSGHELVVWNRDPARTEPLTAAGAVAAESPADAARQAEAVITMVSNPDALRDVTEGPAGVGEGLTPPTALIEMSTVGTEATERLAAALPADAGLLDAPALGSVAEAETGTLKIYAAGEEPLVERWTPLLSTLGSVIHVGPVGAGSAAKLVANAVLVGVIGVLGEALAVAQGLNLPREVAFEVLETTALADQAKRRRPFVESGEYPPRFALSLARKDGDLILEAAASSGLDLRVTEAAREWLVDAEAAGLGDEDYSAVLVQILRSAP
ncbi:MAG TPA: NAD(P)-dependent oxidoreductase [Gaiellaceae bacterium]|nr:NAD(P)-dependent oxidoreductase [Gaiellaceae bacterium]